MDKMEKAHYIMFDSGIKISKIAEDTNLNRGTLYNLKNSPDTFRRMQDKTLEKLADYYDTLQK